MSGDKTQKKTSACGREASGNKSVGGSSKAGAGYERVKAITEQLENGIMDLFESEQYKKWLTVMGRFHNYSLNNTILICSQRPDATLVAGYHDWQKKFGRNVVKGARAIKILAPAPYKRKVEADKVDPITRKTVLDADGNPEKEIRVIMQPAFRVVNVFDYQDTEGKPLPSVGVDELTGEVKEFEQFFQALKESCPVPIGFEQIPGGAKGYFHLMENRIALQEGMSQIQTVKTLIHEMAHQKCHSIYQGQEGEEDVKLSRNSKEVEAESVAYTICRHYGIDTSDYSFAYIAGYYRNKELPELKASLGRIRDAASEMIHIIDCHLQEIHQKQAVEEPEDRMMDPYSKSNPIRALEDQLEQNDNSFDGILNNLPRPSVLEELRSQQKNQQPGRKREFSGPDFHEQEERSLG